MSLSKRWTPFGGSSRGASGPIGGSGSGGNYDSLQGFYRPDTPEALMRKLADYAFMLRDFKLARDTYDILRGDYNNDKAWKYYAGANEMAAVSMLLAPQNLSSRSRSETVDQMLETASYSYITRCIAPYHALRTLATGLELLKLRGPSAADAAARWADRVLENGLVGPVGHALSTERVGACYASRVGLGALHLGSRRRKTALWAILAADQWLKLGMSIQAEKCLNDAGRLYGLTNGSEQALAFPEMLAFYEELRQAAMASRLASHGLVDSEAPEADEETLVEEVSEQFDQRNHRRSLIGAAAPVIPENEPLTPLKSDKGAEGLEGRPVDEQPTIPE